MKYLIAEDDSFSRKVLSAMLEPYGSVQSVENGTLAVDAFKVALEQGEPFTMVCLDVIMPDMDGREALRQIRKLERKHGLNEAEQEVVVIMTTSVRDKAIIEETFVNQRAAAYMVKPVRRADLLTILRDFDIAEVD